MQIMHCRPLQLYLQLLVMVPAEVKYSWMEVHNRKMPWPTVFSISAIHTRCAQQSLLQILLSVSHFNIDNVSLHRYRHDIQKTASLGSIQYLQLNSEVKPTFSFNGGRQNLQSQCLVSIPLPISVIGYPKFTTSLCPRPSTIDFPPRTQRPTLVVLQGLHSISR